MCKPPFFANAICGGMYMDSKDYWQMFLETGAPEYYLLFYNAQKMERSHVLDYAGACTKSYNVQ